MPDQKLSNKERLREITEGIEQGIKELFESEKYMKYLSTMSRFHRYSVNNTMLIYLQKPEATLVAGFNRWKNQFERHVKKGEHGITIIAPTPFKKKIEEQKLDPDTKTPVLDKDGRIMIEEKEVEIPMFRPVKVFDLSQTDGKPLPQLASDLAGNVEQYEAFMEALRRSAPVPITVQPISVGMDGYFSLTEQRIAIREGMSQVQTVSAAVHEIAHSKLHNYEKERQAAAAETEAKAVKPKDRHTEEVEAESISYAVCQYYGIQTGANSFGYIASWSQGRELSELKASLDIINKTASGLITDIDSHYTEICKERGIDLTIQQGQEVPKKQEILASDFVQKDEVTSEPISKPEPESVPEAESGFSRYYITQESRAYGSYPFMIGGQVHENKELTAYENGTIKAFGYIDYPQPLSAEQVEKFTLVSAPDNLNLQEQSTGQLSFYVAECMEFPSLGEYHENLSLAEAVRLYEAIPADRMNGIKGIGFSLQDGSSYEGEFAIVEGRHIDLDTINHIPYYRNNPMVQKAISDVMNALPDIEIYRSDQEKERSDIQTDQQETAEESYRHEVDAVSEMHHTVAGELPEVPEQGLDEYPLPDTEHTSEELEQCGYLDRDLLPLSRDRAIELYRQDLTVYVIMDKGQAEMVFDEEDFINNSPSTLFAVSREEWEQHPDFDNAIKDRMNHQLERETAFLSQKEDCFAIYQLKDTDETMDYRYEGIEHLKERGLLVDREHYDLVYTASLTGLREPDHSLESLFERFNLDPPSDYHSPSLSVSDIVALKQNGMVSCHYVDSFGFQQLPEFIQQENYLKNTEISVEDDYDMIDGIINNGPKLLTVEELEQQASTGHPISLMELAEASHWEEKEKKKSVVECLKNFPKQKEKKTAPKKSAEREL